MGRLVGLLWTRTFASMSQLSVINLGLSTGFGRQPGTDGKRTVPLDKALAGRIALAIEVIALVMQITSLQ